MLHGADAVEATAPRMNGKRTGPVTGGRQQCASAILPPWAHKTPEVTEVLRSVRRRELSSG